MTSKCDSFEPGWRRIRSVPGGRARAAIEAPEARFPCRFQGRCLVRETIHVAVPRAGAAVLELLHRNFDPGVEKTAARGLEVRGLPVLDQEGRIGRSRPGDEERAEGGHGGILPRARLPGAG